MTSPASAQTRAGIPAHPPVRPELGYFMKAKGYAWLRHAGSLITTFIKIDVPMVSSIPPETERLEKRLRREIEMRYAGTFIDRRFRIIVADPVRNQAAFHCPENRTPIPYGQMMDREVEDLFLKGIRAGRCPAEMSDVLSVVTVRGHHKFFLHVFGYGASLWCSPCQALMEDWRALKLGREEGEKYRYFVFNSPLKFA